jgi:hypothetical protein
LKKIRKIPFLTQKSVEGGNATPVKKNIFRWDKKKIEVKLIATILYYAEIFLRKTSKFLGDFEKFSHEAVALAIDWE